MSRTKQYEPPATPAQKALLRKFGVNPRGMSIDKARWVIQGIAESGWKRPDGVREKPPSTRESEPATRKQIETMFRYGVEGVGFRRGKATWVISAIAASGWKLPERWVRGSKVATLDAIEQEWNGKAAEVPKPVARKNPKPKPKKTRVKSRASEAATDPCTEEEFNAALEIHASLGESYSEEDFNIAMKLYQKSVHETR